MMCVLCVCVYMCGECACMCGERVCVWCECACACVENAYNQILDYSTYI